MFLTNMQNPHIYIRMGNQRRICQILRQKEKEQNEGSNTNHWPSSNLNFRLISFTDILRATNNFKGSGWLGKAVLDKFSFFRVVLKGKLAIMRGKTRSG